MKAHLSYITVIIILFIALILERSCHKCPGSVTNIKTDTFFKLVKSDTIYVPQPYAVNGKPIIKNVHDTLTLTDTLIKQIPAKLTDADCAAIARRYFNTYSYADTNKHDFGYSVLREEVTQNRVLSRQWENHFKIPVVTNTKTVNRGQIYAGFNLFGNKTDLLNGFGPELLWKTKGDQIYQIGAVYNTGGIINYQAGMMWKITFKK